MSETSTPFFVIGAGLPRTGTSSLKTALEILYPQPCYHLIDTITKTHHGDIMKWQKLLNETRKLTPDKQVIYQGLSEILNGYSSVVDIPACGFYQELMSLYPTSKVVLTIRDKYQWLSSLRQTILPKPNHYSHRLLINKIQQILGLNHEFMQMILDSLRFAFQTNTIDFNVEDSILLTCYEQYHRAVIDNVPSNRLLIHQFQDGWQPLCEFLNLNIPDGGVLSSSYPHINKRQETFKQIEFLLKDWDLQL
ncbi:unnamed protein product [Schistosoma turkestanicum]|nr:unnamed protein product [Schistosoma turkestanicum]